MCTFRLIYCLDPTPSGPSEADEDCEGANDPFGCEDATCEETPDSDERYKNELREFVAVYESMGTGIKWTLSSGTCVEDILYSRCRDMGESEFHHSIHRFFVFDTSDKSLLSKTDLEEVNNSFPDLISEPDHSLTACLDPYTEVRRKRHGQIFG